MGNCLAVIRKALGQNINISSNGHAVEKSKKKGAVWAMAAAVGALAVILFSTLTVVGASLAISAFVTGAGTALGVFQLFNTITNLFLVVVLVYLMANCIKNARYHLSGRKIVHMPSIDLPIQRVLPLSPGSV